MICSIEGRGSQPNMAPRNLPVSVLTVSHG